MRPECAGKLIALGAYGRADTASAEERALIDYLFDDRSFADGDRFDTYDLSRSPWFDIGVEAEAFKDIAAMHSDALFDRFSRFAERPGEADVTRGHVLAWVQGRCEIGPRALGHRSLLAAPFDGGDPSIASTMSSSANAIGRSRPFASKTTSAVC